MIKAIIFDCFGVLTTDTWNAFLDMLPEEVDIQAAREVHRAYDSGLISKQECNDQITEITGHVFTELEDMRMTVVKNNSLLTHIRRLKKKYKIGLLSNVGGNWVRDDFLTASEQQLFDAMTFSFEEGMNKPDPRIFTIVADKLAVQPKESIMVDDKQIYCEAARAVGMQAIWYRDFPQFKAELEAILSHA